MTREEENLVECYAASLELARRSAEMRDAIRNSVDRMAILLNSVDRFLDAQDRWSENRIKSLPKYVEENENGN